MNIYKKVETPIKRLNTGIIEMKPSSSRKEKESMLKYARRHKGIISLKPRRNKRYCETVFLSIDAEWVKKNKYENTQLSWQAAALGTQQDSEDCLYENSIYYIKNNQRLTLSELTEAALQTIYQDMSTLIRYYFNIKNCKAVLKTLDLSRSEKMRISKSLERLEGTIYPGEEGLKFLTKSIKQLLSHDLWDSVRNHVNKLATQMPVLINLVSHFSVAELMMLADRNSDDLLDSFQSIRKTFYTKKPHQLNLSSGVLCDIHWYDTLLLAPSGYGQLEQLAKLLDDENEEKISIPSYYKEHMDELLETHPSKFKQYALRDTEITLKLFLTIQSMLNKLTFDQPVKLFKTIGSASVAKLLLYEGKDRILNLPPKIPKSKKISPEEIKEIKKKRGIYYHHLPLVRACYHGGRNEGFYRGNTKDDPVSMNRVYFDFDFASCYPTGMALIPRIDLTKEPIHEIAFYQITPEVISNPGLKIKPKQHKKIKALYQNKYPWSYQTHRKFKVPETDSTQPSLKSSDRLDLILNDILEDNSQKQLVIQEILKQSLQYNDTLIESWYSFWKEERGSVEKTAPEFNGDKETLLDIPKTAKYQTIGYARVVFRFPAGTQYPCLPMRHENYGLIYPLSGESYATAPEIILAIEMIEYGNQYAGDGDKGFIHCLEAVEMATDLPPENDKSKVIFEYLFELVKERNKYKDEGNEIRQKFLKEYILTVYGKTAQAINQRKTYNIKTGENVNLPYSPISEPYIASMTTGLPRAALSAILFTIERFNRIHKDFAVLISCTTDGLLIGLKRPENLDLSKLFDDSEDPVSCCEALKLFPNGPKFYQALLKNLSLLQLKYSSFRLTQPDYLEIKHIATEVNSVKTRGQIGELNKDGITKTSLITRFGHKPPEKKGDKKNINWLEKNKDPKQIKQEKDEEDAIWLQTHINDTSPKIKTTKMKTLSGTKMILDPQDPIKDLVSLYRKRKINTDWDWKRKLVRRDEADGITKGDQIDDFDPISQPFSTFEEMLNYRKAADKIRRGVKKATPDLVTSKILNPDQVSRLRGSIQQYTIRAFLRGLLQGVLPTKSQKLPSYADCAKMINNIFPDSKTHECSLKNAKRTAFESNIIPINRNTNKWIGQLCEIFDVDVDLALGKLRIKQSHGIDGLSERVLAAFVVGLIKAKEQDIAGFNQLTISQQPMSTIMVNLHEILNSYPTNLKLQELMGSKFLAHQLPSTPQTRKFLDSLLRSVATDYKQSKASGEITSDAAHWKNCKGVIFTKPPKNKPRRNPAQLKCLKSFVQAVSQSHVCGNPYKSDKEFFQRLYKFGMNRTLYYQLKKSKFTGHTLSDDVQNKKTIKDLCKATDLGNHFEMIKKLLLENKISSIGE